jgi:hypothetical protein
MAQQGGYQPPRKPAPVSGPGPMSQRTDGQPMRQLGNAEYGEQKQFSEIQGGAAMAKANPLANIVPLTAETSRPDEPVTAGAPSGPGLGMAAIGVGQNAEEQNRLDASAIAEFLPSLERMANQPGTPVGFVRFVKYVREMAP